MTIAVALIFSQSPAFADSEQNKSVNTILDSIRQSQKIDKNSDIDCGKIANEQFEELGDAVMNVMHPDEDQHRLMDQMMGGEGSESLEAMHIAMGRKYLGCWSGDFQNVYGMMGGAGMMNGNIFNGSGMMGNFGYMMGSGWLTMVLFWIVLIASIVLFLKWIANKDKPAIKEKSALDILKERYARGEIDKNEFEEKKKGLI